VTLEEKILGYNINTLDPVFTISGKLFSLFKYNILRLCTFFRKAIFHLIFKLIFTKLMLMFLSTYGDIHRFLVSF